MLCHALRCVGSPEKAAAVLRATKDEEAEAADERGRVGVVGPEAAVGSRRPAVAVAGEGV